MSNSNIVFIDSSCVGALSLTGQTGSLVAVLYQALVTGGPSVSIDSITRSGSTATASKNNHGFQMIATGVGQWIVIAGADQSEYNGMHQITSVSANSFTFEVSGTPATPATGTITSQFAPLGWTRTYTGTNKAVFNGDALSDGLRYQFLDDGTLTIGARGCKVRGYESMTDVDTGLAAVPTVAQSAASLIVKSASADNVARDWFILGDGQGFYLGTRFSTSASYYYEFYYFGDCVSETAGDAYRGSIVSNYTDNSSAYNAPHASNLFLASTSISAVSSGKYKTRGYNQSPGAIGFGSMLNSSVHATLGLAGMAYPNPANNGFHLAIVRMTDGSRLIGKLPGVYDMWHDTSSLLHKGIIDDVPGLSGRKLISLKATTSAIQVGVVFDMTGPWR